ncbi:MAG: hypothetical protein ACK46Q_04700 [Hyphomonas sp.]
MLVIIYPFACGLGVRLWNDSKVADYLGWIAAFFPVLGYLVFSLSTRGVVRVHIFDLLTHATVMLFWGLLYWGGRKLGQPFAEILSEKKAAREARKTEEKFR